MKREELTYLDLKLFFRRWWILIIISGFIFLSLVFFIPQKYQASITMNIQDNTASCSQKIKEADISTILNKTAYIINKKNLESTINEVNNKLSASQVMKNIFVIENVKNQDIQIKYQSENQGDLIPILTAIANQTAIGMKDFAPNTNVKISNSFKITKKNNYFESLFLLLFGIFIGIMISLVLDILKEKFKRS